MEAKFIHYSGDHQKMFAWSKIFVFILNVVLTFFLSNKQVFLLRMFNFLRICNRMFVNFEKFCSLNVLCKANLTNPMGAKIT